MTRTTLCFDPPCPLHWRLARDGDPLLLAHPALCQPCRNGQARHGRRGKDEELVLVCPTLGALFVWRRLARRAQEEGIFAAVFRNRSGADSPALIREAMGIAWARWPRQRLYSFVPPGRPTTPQATKAFLQAGWQQAGVAPCGLLILEFEPSGVCSFVVPL